MHPKPIIYLIIYIGLGIGKNSFKIIWGDGKEVYLQDKIKKATEKKDIKLISIL